MIEGYTYLSEMKLFCPNNVLYLLKNEFENQEFFNKISTAVDFSIKSLTKKAFFSLYSLASKSFEKFHTLRFQN